MSTIEDDYPCLGVCTLDADGYCIGCGRPPPLEPAITPIDDAVPADGQLSVAPGRANPTD